MTSTASTQRRSAAVAVHKSDNKSGSNNDTQNHTAVRQAAEGRRITRIVFIALLLDILSFTIILPLLPRSLEAYKAREGSDPSTLLGWTLSSVAQLRHRILGWTTSRFLQQGARADLVLLGGIMGSVYSLLQCVVAPVIGRVSDRLGRRRTLMVCMAGNVVWTVLWVFSSSFESFLLARVIAGLSEGNVQISNTVIADVTDASTRSKGMALVGIAFAVGFTLGPSIGAYFSTKMSAEGTGSSSYAPFAAAAVFSLALLLAESLYLYFKLPETLHFKKSTAKDDPDAVSEKEVVEAKQTIENNANVQQVLRRLNIVHFAYLFFFSGMEYTLTFLTHDKFNFSNMQQGRLLGFIGIMSTILQGGYVRRVKGRSSGRGDKSLVTQGMVGCTLGLLSIALCCISADKSSDTSPSWWLWAGAVGFAVASATVVNCLNSMVSLAGAHQQTQAAGDTGKRLGDFRSAGQIGRALGPVFACSVYWLSGAAVCYLVGAVAVSVITVVFVAAIPAATTTKRTATLSPSRSNKTKH
ncbi:hypothetical protein H4S07_002115 [Coemansia furcata]|uniref:Uncharacterized protein n=1 Tax=Coemansia furcata TaxID=417177 RepID=A0ACC1LLN4_9FUNG|nr:hypothetical protein H4S07_002115 [Coemansia furcata]